MPCSYSYLQVNFYKRFYGVVSITVVLKESDNKVEGLSPMLRVRAPVGHFFIFYFFAFAKKQEIFRDLHFWRKKHVLMYYAHVKRLHSVKWRGLYGDTATMQELLLKTCTSSAWRKRSLEWNCQWIVYGTGLQHPLALSDLPLRKLWKRRRRHMTSSNSQSNHRYLRRKCHWMTLTRVLYGGPSPAYTPWRRLCQPLITSEQSSNRLLVTLAARVVFAKISFIRSLLTHAVGWIKRCWWRDKI